MKNFAKIIIMHNCIAAMLTTSGSVSHIKINN